MADLGLMQALASGSSSSSASSAHPGGGGGKAPSPSTAAAAAAAAAEAAASQRALYAAPEQLAAGQRCTLAVDLYSFGVLLVELCTHQQGQRQPQQLWCEKRGGWRLPRVPQDCPQVSNSACQHACLPACPPAYLPVWALL